MRRAPGSGDIARNGLTMASRVSSGKRLSSATVPARAHSREARCGTRRTREPDVERPFRSRRRRRRPGGDRAAAAVPFGQGRSSCEHSQNRCPHRTLFRAGGRALRAHHAAVQRAAHPPRRGRGGLADARHPRPHDPRSARDHAAARQAGERGPGAARADVVRPSSGVLLHHRQGTRGPRRTWTTRCARRTKSPSATSPTPNSGSSSSCWRACGRRIAKSATRSQSRRQRCKAGWLVQVRPRPSATPTLAPTRAASRRRRRRVAARRAGPRSTAPKNGESARPPRPGSSFDSSSTSTRLSPALATSAKPGHSVVLIRAPREIRRERRADAAHRGTRARTLPDSDRRRATWRVASLRWPLPRGIGRARASVQPNARAIGSLRGAIGRIGATPCT